MAATEAPPPDKAAVAAEEPLPFEAVLAPFVQAARERLAATSPAEALDALPTLQIERLLLRRLAELWSRVLYLELTLERTARMSPFERLLARCDGDASGVYDAFVDRMCGGGVNEVLREYPVLGRLSDRLVEMWVAATAELLERLAHDRAELERDFGNGAALGPVVAVQPGLSDPHRHGRMVAALTFESGLKLAYKPKPLAGELAWQQLLAWFNAQGAPLDFRVLTVLARERYGWAEWVQHHPCSTGDEASRFYRRAGMLVCLVYALAGSDCHRDNVVASGEYPVLVDTECLMQHRARLEGGPARAWELARDQLVSGVLGTGLLPAWQVGPQAEARPATDISALHTVRDEDLVIPARRWEHINSDGMALCAARLQLPIPHNQPMLDGRPLQLEEHADEVLAGFEELYAFLLGCRSDLLASDSPLRALERQPARFLFRSTRVYGDLDDQLRQPEYLRSEQARREELERLGRAASAREGFNARWRPVVDAEIDALDRLDVPIFMARADETVLDLDGEGETRDCLREPSAELVARRLRGLGQPDLQQQLSFIAGSLYVNSARHEPARRRAGGGGGVAARDDVDLVAMASDIADEMATMAVRAGPSGGASWIAPQYLPRLERYQLQPVSFDLHSGSCGIALFLSAAARITRADRYAELALAALQPVREALAEHPARLADALGCGGAVGLGSVVYSLARAGSLLEDSTLIEEAAVAAALLSDERIMRAPADVFQGLAGELLGQLAVYSAAGDTHALQRAVRCGQRLLEMRACDAAGHRAWITYKDRLLTGFSHGAAGIAYALLRLYAASDDVAFRGGAAEAIAHESTLFDPDVGNWLDLREDDQPSYKANWCHGAPGIGLARLGAIAMLDDAAVRADIDAALRTTLSVDLDGPDHLCCGNLGRADALLVAGQRLGSPEFSMRGRERIAQIAARARTTGSFALHDSLPRRVYMPGLFMGMAGVGYELLRAARPDLLVSPLLWEL